MQERLDSSPWLQKIRWLSHALIISGALNIGFLGTFFTMTFKNLRKEKQLVAMQPTEEGVRLTYASSLGVELLSEYFDYSYDQLRKELENKELVEDGYAKRDYALACLVAFHYFDIHKALSGTVIQTRMLDIVHKEGGERMRLEVFPGLQDAHFNALMTFSKLEKWPLTSQGLYLKMQQIHDLSKIPPSLKEAFYLTPHFHCLWRLFHRIDISLSSLELLQVVIDADWEWVDGAYQMLCRTQDFGEESRRSILLQLIQRRSQFAAQFFLQYDREFALTKLDDQSILFILSQVDRGVSRADGFARQLLVSVRSDAVLHSAGRKLYELSGEKPPVPYDHTQALIRFLPNFFQKEDFIGKSTRKEAESVIPLMAARRYHVVVKGDTLWKIAADYHVNLKELMKVNHLTSGTIIKPGIKLELP